MKHALVQPRRRHVWRWIIGLVVVALMAVPVYVFTRAQHAVDTATKGVGGSAIDILLPKPLLGESTGRVNILLAGNSFDDAGHDGAELTDSIMVASMDISTKHLALVSIPRDLWVDYRGGPMKINAVYVKGGMPGLAEVAEQVTGLTINQNVLVGYAALMDAVNAVGGIDVTIASRDPRGIYDANQSLRLANGTQHIDGATALKLARARNHPTPGVEVYGIPRGDFDREQNQRMIIAALMDKVKNTPTLANPATMIEIFDSISVNVRTDLTVSQVRRIYDLTSGADAPESISILGTSQKPLLVDYRAGSADALVPAAGKFDYSIIQQYVASACAAG